MRVESERAKCANLEKIIECNICSPAKSQEDSWRGVGGLGESWGPFRREFLGVVSAGGSICVASNNIYFVSVLCSDRAIAESIPGVIVA